MLPMMPGGTEIKKKLTDATSLKSEDLVVGHLGFIVLVLHRLAIGPQIGKICSVIGSGDFRHEDIGKERTATARRPFVLLPEIATLHCGISLAIVITVKSPSGSVLRFSCRAISSR